MQRNLSFFPILSGTNPPPLPTITPVIPTNRPPTLVAPAPFAHKPLLVPVSYTARPPVSIVPTPSTQPPVRRELFPPTFHTPEEYDSDDISTDDSDQDLSSGSSSSELTDDDSPLPLRQPPSRTAPYFPPSTPAPIRPPSAIRPAVRMTVNYPGTSPKIPNIAPLIPRTTPSTILIPKSFSPPRVTVPIPTVAPNISTNRIPPPTIRPPTVSSPRIPVPRIPVPTVSVPRIPAPTIPKATSPRIPAPTIPKPTSPRIPAPRIPKAASPRIPAPTIPAPRIPAPTIPAPTIPVPRIAAPTIPIPRIAAPTIPKMTAPGIPAPRIPPPKVASPRIPTPKVASPRIPAPTIGAPRIPAPTIGAPRIPAPTIGAPRIPAPTIVAPRIPAPTIGAPRIPAPTIVAPRIPAPTIGTPRIPAPKMASPRIVHPTMAAPRIPAPKVASPRIIPVRMVAPTIPVPRMTSPRIATATIVAPKIPVPRMTSPRIATVKIVPPTIPKMASPRIPTATIVAPIIPVPRMASPRMAVPKTVSPKIISPKKQREDRVVTQKEQIITIHGGATIIIPERYEDISELPKIPIIIQTIKHIQEDLKKEYNDLDSITKRLFLRSEEMYCDLNRDIEELAFEYSDAFRVFLLNNIELVVENPLVTISDIIEVYDDFVEFVEVTNYDHRMNNDDDIYINAVQLIDEFYPIARDKFNLIISNAKQTGRNNIRVASPQKVPISGTITGGPIVPRKTPELVVLPILTPMVTTRIPIVPIVPIVQTRIPIVPIVQTRTPIVPIVTRSPDKDNKTNPIPILRTPKVAKVPMPRSPRSPIVVEEKEECCVCQNKLVSPGKMTKCGHGICAECTKNLRKDECPICRSHLTNGYITEKIKQNIQVAQKQDMRIEQLNDMNYAIYIAGYGGLDDVNVEARSYSDAFGLFLANYPDISDVDVPRIFNGFVEFVRGQIITNNTDPVPITLVEAFTPIGLQMIAYPELTYREIYYQMVK